MFEWANSAMQDAEFLVSGQAVTVRSLVADKIRRAIVQGHYRPGHQLRERELCELTGVSRPSLREALRQLEAEGLITTVPHRGPVVATLTVEQVDQIYTMRRLLEVFAAGEFARLRPAKALEDLCMVTNGLDKAEASDDPAIMMSTGTAFYNAVAAGGGNAYIKDTLLIIHNRLSLIRYLSLHHPARVKQSFKAIRAMCGAIIAGEQKRAEQLCTQHLEAAAVIAKTIVDTGYAVPRGEHSIAA